MLGGWGLLEASQPGNPVHPGRLMHGWRRSSHARSGSLRTNNAERRQSPMTIFERVSQGELGAARVPHPVSPELRQQASQ
jgi:hypothetical protein